MKRLYDELAFAVSQATTQKYSTSFSLGIKAIKPSLRPAIYAIYGYVRIADEIVDSFKGYNQAGLLQQFKIDTHQALVQKISFNPILQSFQEVVHQYKIDTTLIDQFLHSMSLDLQSQYYDEDLYKTYILGSAEVVGLMCLHVFVKGDLKRFEELKPYAMKLGSAFQKINFLRDLKDDYHLLGRTYFPHVDMTKFDCTIKKQIEADINKEFEEALVGIRLLPNSSKFGVYLAYQYYWSLFKKIQRTSSQEILNNRIRIPNTQKFFVMMESYFNYQLTKI